VPNSLSLHLIIPSTDLGIKQRSHYTTHEMCSKHLSLAVYSSAREVTPNRCFVLQKKMVEGGRTSGESEFKIGISRVLLNV